MSKIKLWNVKFGVNWSELVISARTIDEAIRKGRSKFELDKKKDNDRFKSPEITSVDLIAEEN